MVQLNDYNHHYVSFYDFQILIYRIAILQYWHEPGSDFSKIKSLLFRMIPFIKNFIKADIYREELKQSDDISSLCDSPLRDELMKGVSSIPPLR
jgi:hypothetical protein